MKQIFLISLLCLFSTISVFSQSKDQIILVKKRYFVNDNQLSNNDLKTLLKSDPGSAAMLKKAQTNSTIGVIPMTAGVVIILGAEIYNLSQTASGKTVNVLGPVIIGAGLVIVGVPFVLVGSSQMKKSIQLYNSKHTTGYNDNLKLELGITQNGIGLTCKF